MQAQRIARQSQHVSELPTAQNPDRHAGFLFKFAGPGFDLAELGLLKANEFPCAAAGSGLASTRSVCASRNFRSASRISGCFAPRIAAARSAELIAPALPIASVPTGTPPGICAIDSSESSPFNVFDSTGTPSTGRTVFDEVIPGRCAAPPAPAMITSMPRFSADDAYSNSKSGVR